MIDWDNMRATNRWRLLHDLMNIMIDKMDTYVYQKEFGQEITESDVKMIIDYLKTSINNIENLKDDNILLRR